MALDVYTTTYSQQAIYERDRARAEYDRLAMRNGILIGMGGIAGLQGQAIQNHPVDARWFGASSDLQQVNGGRPIEPPNVKINVKEPNLSLKDELQKEVDEWLEDTI